MSKLTSDAVRRKLLAKMCNHRAKMDDEIRTLQEQRDKLTAAIQSLKVLIRGHA